ncbi:sialate O-acetylesterase [Algoriphagus ratkowskyi]|uniref:Sialate O-acetylesterase n=3 Tax=Algoriphagus ratkowskyi TaxID=57028 RepID=A0A2W7RFM4_9BACT|nr:sialate O-acetylesterase [Algoriphagus ratkowskyi]PZX53049.1 sialate O-acetylesterase [Algoriphagus ratkowskyi]
MSRNGNRDSGMLISSFVSEIHSGFLMQTKLTRFKKAGLVFCLFIFTAFFTIAQQVLKPANIFSDHMVLQREQPVPVWGVATPSEEITVGFAGQIKSVIADKSGKWMVKLDPLTTSTVGREMLITGKSKIVLSDILVGEVWICSGQSNMQFPVAAVPEVKGLIPFMKNIRSFEVGRTVSLEESEDVIGEWSTEHPSSAVAFGFAYFLEELSDIPVGIIHSSWGSSSLEAWMPRNMGSELPYFKEIMDEFDGDKATQERIAQILESPTKWSNQDDIFLRRQPNILYNAMIKPLVPFANRGLVWYQGERNTRYLSGVPEVTEENWFHRVAGMKEYGSVLKEWMLRYREEWQNDEMNLLVVMLPGYGKGTEKKTDIDPEDPTEESWAWIRESQLQVLDLPYTAVANTIDLGDKTNIHPTDKLPVGQRLALLAAVNTLGGDRLVTGPMMLDVQEKGSELVVHFSNAKGLKTSDGKAPSGFWLADEAGDWKRAEARLEGESIVLSSEGISQPKYIRYAFAGMPKVNLVNELELPAYPFRTDSFEH